MNSPQDGKLSLKQLKYLLAYDDSDSEEEEEKKEEDEKKKKVEEAEVKEEPEKAGKAEEAPATGKKGRKGKARAPKTPTPAAAPKPAKVTPPKKAPTPGTRRSSRLNVSDEQKQASVFIWTIEEQRSTVWSGNLFRRFCYLFSERSLLA